MTYKNWTICIAPDSITATKDGEELTIRKFGERGMELLKNAIDRTKDDQIRCNR